MIALFLGGTRSGKSELAEHLALACPPPVTYVATGTATDQAMADRIELHRQRRPAQWATVESGLDLPATVEKLEGTILVDSLGTWVARCPDLVVDPSLLGDALTARDGVTIVVSEEVGLGVHPPTAAGRQFADTLGTLNRAVAEIADEVLFVAAGRISRLSPATDVLSSLGANLAQG